MSHDSAQNTNPPGESPQPRPRASVLTSFAISGVTIVLMLLVTAVLWRPDFYVASLQVAAVQQAEVDNQLSELYEAVQTDGQWEFTFTDDHINKWLAQDMPQLLPQVMPCYARDPRIEIRNELAKVACEYVGSKMSAVVSLSLEAFPTDKPNELGIRISNTRVGAVPGLTHEAISQIQYAANRGRIPLRWVKRDGEPEAVIQIPRKLLSATDKKITVAEVSMQDGRLKLVGSTETLPQRKKPANRQVARRPGS